MSPPADSPDRPRDREELAAQLDELESTLTDLRSELRGEGRRGPPQPPKLGDLLRFTEQYTIPTLIAALEATIKSLELLQRTLRLADPARAAREEGTAARGRLDEVGSEAGQQLAAALGELRTALAEADLPENPDSRDLIEDARSLTGEIEGRLRDAERTVSDQRDRERGSRRNAEGASSGGVMIDVGEDGDDTNSDSQQDDSDTDPEVDVDAELESIKNELDRSEQALDEQTNETNDDDSGTADSNESDDNDDASERDEASDSDDEKTADSDND
ncbi:hypothetical protein EGH24_00525 [Halonotius terrestris]|uniref:Uncharacterized protein n=1 Tax=Halonotius terrestris TaxID=2487750 RepID=A0A8J8PB29_9EURY|nr:hypothetical protein [Halonotius terrestris]TQQ83324.1 hypothetical protein EGH24_00525 [Halonotius terrestris]